VTRHPDGERLSIWIAGGLPERDAGAVRAHVAACGRCADVEGELRAQLLALRGLERPEPPPTLWPSIEGALQASEHRPWSWSWRSSLIGAAAGALAVAALAWGLADGRGAVRGGGRETAAGDEDARAVVGDPLLAEAERELGRAAASYEQAVNRLRIILDREQTRWDPEARARVADRLARLDEAVEHSRAIARRDPGDKVGADMLFSAYQRQIDFLAEAVHRGSPAGEGLR
jgi:hypothetical protein